MLADQRFERILTLLDAHGFRTNHALASDLGVSEMTIRRDLDALARQGKVKRVRGGVRILRRPDGDTHQRTSLNASEKQAIAEAAADLIVDGETIYLDSGSTMLELALAIKRRHFRNLRVVTNSVNISGALSRDDLSIVQLGGELYRSTGSVVGQQALRFLESSRFDRCFLAAGGFNLEFGISDKHLPEIEIKRTALQHANWTALAADASKWDKQSMLRVATLRDIQCVITDAGLNTEAQTILRGRGLEVVIADG